MLLKDTYKELAELINTNIAEVKWVDLWANQTEEFEMEFPFPMPAVFIELNSDNIESIGVLAQDINAFVTFHVAYETMAESYSGSYNQTTALAFFDILDNIHKTFHGKHGVNFGRMNRVAVQAEQAGTNIIQYAISFSTIIRDYTAVKEYNETELQGVAVEQGQEPTPPPPSNMFCVNL